MTKVYHKIGFRRQCFERQSFMTLCGSLTDETWILNLLNKTNVIDPFKVVQWDKQLDTPFSTDSACMTFVLVSPNLQKFQCFDHFTYNTETSIVCWLKIANTTTQLRLDPRDRYIDGTTMDQLELAQAIFSLATEGKTPFFYQN